MQFNVIFNMDEVAGAKSGIIKSISQELKNYFKNKNFGDDVQDYSILCICVGKPFQDFFKVHKPTYVYHRIAKNKFTGEMVEMNKLFMNDFKFESEEYDKFIATSDENRVKMFAQKIIKSLDNLDNLPKKVKDFDKEKLKLDMKYFFKEKNLL